MLHPKSHPDPIRRVELERRAAGMGLAGHLQILLDVADRDGWVKVADEAEATFGNVHGIYKPGNVKLRPEILKNSQDLVQQTHGTGHVLQFAVAVGRARQAVERMIGDVKLHDVTSNVGKATALRGHDHALRRLGRARRGEPAGALDLDETKAA